MNPAPANMVYTTPGGAQPQFSPQGVVLSPVQIYNGTWMTQMCCPSDVDCNLCCASTCCQCCVVGANAKMLATNVPVGPCDGSGNECVIHGALVAVSAAVQIVMATLFGGTAAGCYFAPCYAFNFRTRTREKFHIPGQPCEDCLVHYFCSPCVLCQEHLELHQRINTTQTTMSGAVTYAPTAAAVMMQQQRPQVVFGQPVMGVQPQGPHMPQPSHNPVAYPPTPAPATVVHPPPLAHM